MHATPHPKATRPPVTLLTTVLVGGRFWIYLGLLLLAIGVLVLDRKAHAPDDSATEQYRE